MPHVLLTWFATPEEVRRVKAGLPKGTTIAAPKARAVLSRFETKESDLAPLCGKADALMGWTVPPTIWAKTPKLKALAWLHAGCDELDFAMLKRRGVKVANIRGGNGIAVAEHAMALMLSSAKRIVERHNWLLEARWQPIFHPDFRGTLLEGKTLAVVGLGEIGTAVARRAKSFDMTVLGIRRHAKRGGRFADEVHGPEALHKVLKRADFVVLAAPLTPETEGFIDAKALAAMKRGAHLINIARGNMIVEADLHAALAAGRLGGYASDVWWNYTNSFPATYHFPIVSRTGVQRFPRVTGTGDQASAVDSIVETEIRMGTESLAAFFKGRPMPRQIDLGLGY